MKTKKIVSAIASVALVLGLCPATALATEADDTNVGGGVADFIVSPADDAAAQESNVLPTEDSENIYESTSESSYANSEELSFSAVTLATDDITGGELGTCTWVIDSEGCLTIAPADGVSGEFELTNPSYHSWPWYDYRGSVTSAKVESGVSATGSLAYMFYYCSSLTSLDLSNFDTSNVTDMFGMFWGCSSLTFLDLSGFDTSNIMSMSYMFCNCSSLTSLDLSSLDTSKVTNMSSMFYGCSSITSLDLSGFDTSNVTNMSDMFSGCSSITSLDLSGFGTSNVTSMQAMFYRCSSITSLDISNFDISNVTTMYCTFAYCSSITSLDISNFDTSNVTTMYCTFEHCSLLTSLDISSFNTSNVIDMSYMFHNCSSITSLDISNFDTSKVTSMNHTFEDCSSLTSLDLLSFNTSNVTDMVGMFVNCSSLTTLDVSNFDTSNVTRMFSMFADCASLTSLDLSSFDTSNVADMSNMFSGCSNLRSVTVGEGFAFTDDAYLPVPTLNGIEGKWRDSNGIIYDDPSDLPNNVATTYTVVFVDVFNDAGADISDLMTEVAEAEAFNSADYTEESWGVMQMSLISARAVLDDPNASQVEVDSAAIALSDAIAALVPTSGTQEKTMTVYAGENRYETANAIAAAVAEQGPYKGVIVCSAASGKFADALCASGLSGVLDYPIVLTDGSLDSLDAGTAAAISALFGGGQGDVIVLGGSSTISNGIRIGLGAYDTSGAAYRIAGEDRYDTADAIYAYGAKHGSGWSTDYAVLAVGNNFPDALGAASFCTSMAVPMLLTNQNSDDLEAYAANAAAKANEVIVIGGTNSVSDAKSNPFANAVRMAGADRYDTNLQFAAWQIENGMTLNGAGVATGTNFPDSLGSSYLLSLTNSVLLLSSPDDNSALYSLLSDNASSINAISVFGGDNSVSVDTRSAIQSAIGGEWTTVNK